MQYVNLWLHSLMKHANSTWGVDLAILYRYVAVFSRFEFFHSVIPFKWYSSKSCSAVIPSVWCYLNIWPLQDVSYFFFEILFDDKPVFCCLLVITKFGTKIAKAVPTMFQNPEAAPCDKIISICKYLNIIIRTSCLNFQNHQQ